MTANVRLIGVPGRRILLADARGAETGYIQVVVDPPPTVTVKLWKCGNCGHEAPQTDELKELSFRWLGPCTSKTSCPNCGSYTLQRAFDETFKAGYFLVIKSKNGIRGKGKWT